LKKSNGKGPTGFKLDGEPLSLDTTPPAAKRIAAFLDGLADDDLKTTSAVAAATQVSEPTLEKYGLHVALRGYSVVYKHRKFYGSRKAIVAFCQEIGVQE